MIRLEAWGENDLYLLQRTNTPEMTEFLGGPEPEEKLLDRHKRYLDLEGKGQMFRVVLLPEEVVAGSIGYWEKVWQGETVFEAGWGVLPEFQGRGVAVEATKALIERARAEKKHRYLHAYPKVVHAASNAVCRKAGFELLGEQDFEYPPGNHIRCNDWQFDLLG